MAPVVAGPRRPALAMCFVLFTLLLAGCGSAVRASGSTAPAIPRVALPSPRAGMVVQADQQYGPYSQETLDLCLPTHRTGVHPGVVLIHGGAWMQGDKSRWLSLCERLATFGLVAATINYRLAPQWAWPAQLVDAQLAVRWLRAQAPRLALDERRLCAYGDSAGGHLAVFLGTLHTIHSGDLADALATWAPDVSCVVDDFGPTDLVSLFPTPLGQYIAAPLFSGATPRSDAVLYRDASPVFAVSPQTAPMLILQGTRDGVVPVGQSTELERTLRARGVPVRYVAYVGDHEFVGLSSADRTALEDLTIAFLLEHTSA